MSINTKQCIIEVNGVVYDVDYADADWPTARIYEVTERGGELLEGIEAKISYEDSDSINPRKDYDNFGVMISIGNRDYNWGDEQWVDRDYMGGRPSFSVECDACDASGWVKAGSEHAVDKNDPGDEDGDVTCGKCNGNQEIEQTLEEHLRSDHDAVVILGVSFQDYGSSARCWVTTLDNDGSDNGVIYATKAKIAEEFGDEDIDAPLNEHTQRAWGDNPPTTRREHIERLLKGEVETYCQYMEGDVYWYSVEDGESDYNDSCGGIFGCDYAEEEIYRAIEGAIEKRAAEMAERAEWAARDTITV